MPPVNLDDLTHAMDWVSASMGLDNAAYVSRATGRVIWVGDGIDDADEIPPDIEDGTQYVAVPSRQDLDLGRRLAISFVETMLPSALGQVHDAFRKRGAYSRFKRLLERAGLLEAWYQFESDATERALENWALARGLRVARAPDENEG